VAHGSGYALFFTWRNAGEGVISRGKERAPAPGVTVYTARGTGAVAADVYAGDTFAAGTLVFILSAGFNTPEFLDTFPVNTGSPHYTRRDKILRFGAGLNNHAGILGNPGQISQKIRQSGEQAAFGIRHRRPRKTALLLQDGKTPLRLPVGIEEADNNPPDKPFQGPGKGRKITEMKFFIGDTAQKNRIVAPYKPVRPYLRRKVPHGG
jgi:hypothetical protein